MYYQNKCVTIDNSQPQLVIITFSEIEPNDKEFEDYLATQKKLLEESQPFIQIIDTTFSKNLKSELRVKLNKWIDVNRELLAKKVKEAILVVPGSFMRIITSGILKFSNPPYPNTTVATLEEALKLVDKKLGKAQGG